MITKKKSSNPILAWIQNEDNMNVVYGLGAAVVILGALFKLQGWPGANIMLILAKSLVKFFQSLKTGVKIIIFAFIME